MDDAFTLFQQKVNKAIEELDSIHVDTIFACKFKVITKDEENDEVKYFNTKGNSIFHTTNLKKWYNEFLREPVLRDIVEFETKESGWTLYSILNLTIFLKKFQAMRGGAFES